MKKRGVFITFEGGDGAGKTTLIEKIYHSLEKASQPVIKTRAPGGTSLGQEIRTLLLHSSGSSLSKRAELLLFLADRAQHVDELITPALNSGKIVLCDRFNDSTLAYQGGARGFPEEKVKGLCDFACGSLTPDLTIYLDLDPEIGFARAQKAGLQKDRIESEALTFHQEIRKAYLAIGKKEPKRFMILDASLSPEEVYAHALQKITALLQAKC